MQSGPIQRDLYVRSPKHLDLRQRITLKLLRLPYGIVEPGRQCICVLEEWVLQMYKIERTVGVEQMIYQKGEGGRIILIVTKVVHDLLIYGTETAIDDLLNNLYDQFKVGNCEEG